MLALALGHEQVNHPHDPSSCSHRCFVATYQVWGAGQMEAQHPTDLADPLSFWCYKYTSVDAVICNLLPTNSPFSSHACIRPPGLFCLRYCAALTFCLCLFESRPRSWVLLFASRAPQSPTTPLCVVYQSRDLLPRLLLLPVGRYMGHGCHILSNLSFSISLLLSSLFTLYCVLHMCIVFTSVACCISTHISLQRHQRNSFKCCMLQ